MTCLAAPKTTLLERPRRPDASRPACVKKESFWTSREIQLADLADEKIAYLPLRLLRII
jgi:hypothetical protein